MNRVPTVLIAGLIVALTRSGIARADASQTSSAGADGGSLYVEIGSAGGDLVDHADAAQPAPMVEWIDCGVISDVDSAGAMCRQAAQTCYADRLNDGLPVSGVNDQTHYRVQVTRQADGSWLVTDTSCLIPNVEGQAGPDFAGAAFEEIRRLVPSPRIGVAPAGGASLVHIQTLLWLQTKPDVDLGTARLFGARVGLRAHLDHVVWDFGDGTGETTRDVGRAYTAADRCATVMCPGYWGHVYVRRGLVRITARVSWTGEYRVGAGPWQAIAGQATAAPAMTSLTVKQARGVLVPNPDD